MTTDDLFADPAGAGSTAAAEPLAPGLWRLRLLGLTGELLPHLPHVPWATPNPTAAVQAAVDEVAAAAPFRHQRVPGGGQMSVATTNCGAWGWTADTRGYRYARADPLTGLPWPALPPLLLQLARSAAEFAGYAAFAPDACLINRYRPGASMGLHQDKDEASFDHPIVSLSLGAPATFLWGGARRADPVQRCLLQHGDVLVWGGAARLNFHGVARLAAHPAHPERINLTLRRARA
jgi:DNA oxidative demethylase